MNTHRQSEGTYAETGISCWLARVSAQYTCERLSRNRPILRFTGLNALVPRVLKVELIRLPTLIEPSTIATAATEFFSSGV